LITHSYRPPTHLKPIAARIFKEKLGLQPESDSSGIGYMSGVLDQTYKLGFRMIPRRIVRNTKRSIGKIQEANYG